MRTLAPGIHVVDAPQRFLGLELGARMTLLELEGGLLAHAPVAVDPTALGVSWDFDRLVMAHGDVIETGGRQVIAEAYGWLWG